MDITFRDAEVWKIIWAGLRALGHKTAGENKEYSISAAINRNSVQITLTVDDKPEPPKPEPPHENETVQRMSEANKTKD